MSPMNEDRKKIIQQLMDGLNECFKIVGLVNESPKALLELKLSSTYVENVLMTVDLARQKLKK